MQVVVNILVSASVYVLVGVGFSIILLTGRFFHFAHGAIFTVGAYAAYTAHSAGVSVPLALVVGVACSAVVGAACEALVYRPLRRRGGNATGLLLAGLGLYVVFENAVSLAFGDSNLALQAGLDEVLSLAGARCTVGQAVIFVSSAAVLFASLWLWNRTKVGLLMRAVSDDRDLAAMKGVNPDRVLLVAFVVGSAVAGLGGVLIGLDIDLNPAMGFNALLMGVSAVIVGGIGRLEGVVWGALLVASTQHLGVWVLPSQWQNLLVFTLLGVCLLIRREGLLVSEMGA